MAALVASAVARAARRPPPPPAPDRRPLSGAAASTSGRGASPARRARAAPCCASGVSDAPAPLAAAGAAPAAARYDLVALSNLCVDAFVEVDALPAADAGARRALLAELTAAPPPRSAWEVGGQTNLLIAAARLGMRAAAVGHVGADAAGAFLAGVLADEGVELVSPLDSAAAAALPPGAGATLLCFVLVAPEEGAHAFCSAYDFGPWPLLGFLRGLPPRAAAALDGAAALFVNGFVFDELPAEAVLAAAARARARGAAVFFDPGPRAWTFRSGPRAAALAAMLDASDVVLMTEEEAEAVTGVASAEAAARAVLARPGAATRWCVVKRGACGALLAVREEEAADGSGGEHALFEEAAIPVTVRDTVGCGDSYAAAVVLGYTRRLPIPATLALAAAVGAATATGAGAGRNVARAADVAALLEGAVAGGGGAQHANALDVLRASLAAAEPR